MADAKPPLVAELIWDAGLRFGATSGPAAIVIDGDGAPALRRCSWPRLASRAAWRPTSSPFSRRAATRSPACASRSPASARRTRRAALLASRCISSSLARCARGRRRSRDRAVARDVLLGLALDAPGHRLRHHLRHPPVKPGPSSVEGRRAIPRLAARRRGADHDRGAHARLVDARGRPRQRGLSAGRLIVGGFGAPFFLFLAGVSLALAAGARLRKGQDRRRSRRARAPPRLADLRPRVSLPAPVVGHQRRRCRPRC